MGFGLTISKNIVEQLGGQISVEPSHEMGSIFTFSVKAEALGDIPHDSG